LYTSCVLGLRSFALFNEIITYQKKKMKLSYVLETVVSIHILCK
jgi:hypothetical protein